MFTKEDLDSWNELFPDCKIKDTDVANPTEQFLIKTLISYLRIFGYKVEPPFAPSGECSDMREKVVFMTKITRHIDHILKITDSSYTFTCYDLIRPTTKKTSHMLGILLNYLYYYNMYKTEVSEMAKERITERVHLIKSIAEMKDDIQKRKTKAEKIHEKLALLKEQLPTEEESLKTLSEKFSELSEEVNHAQTTEEELQTQLQDLQAEKAQLEKHTVPDSEASELKTQLAKVKEEMEERKKAETATRKAFITNKESTLALQEMFKMIETAEDIPSTSILDIFQDKLRNLKQKKTGIKDLAQKDQELSLVIEKQKRELKDLTEKIEAQRTKFETEKQAKTQTIEENQKLFQRKTAELACVNSEIVSHEALIEEQQSILTYIKESETLFASMLTVPM